MQNAKCELGGSHVKGGTRVTPEEMKRRTQRFALGIMRLAPQLGRGPVADVLVRQLIRCGTSVGANYRAACAARSGADFVAKLGIVQEEADECVYWLELATAGGLARAERVAALIQEAREILAMTVASIRTARARATDARRRPAPPNSQSAICNPQSPGVADD